MFRSSESIPQRTRSRVQFVEPADDALHVGHGTNPVRSFFLQGAVISEAARLRINLAQTLFSTESSSLLKTSQWRTADQAGRSSLAVRYRKKSQLAPVLLPSIFGSSDALTKFLEGERTRRWARSFLRCFS